MRTTRLVLAGASAGALLAGLAFTAAPAAFGDSVTCAQAQFAVNQAVAAEQGTKAKVSTAQSALNSAQADLDTDLNIVATGITAGDETPAVASADISEDQTQVAADQQALTNAQNADNVAVANITAAQTAANTACATATPPPVVQPPAATPPPAEQAPPSTVVIYKWINGRKCKCVADNCTPVTAPPTTTTAVQAPPPPARTIVEQAPPPPARVIVEQQPVVVPPAQIFTTPVAPSIGSVATGDGSLADIINPVPVIPSPGTVTVTLGLGNILNLVTLPGVPVLPVAGLGARGSRGC